MLNKIRGYKVEHTISIMAEFVNKPESLKTIAKLSDYISSINNSATILMDYIQFQSGYRVTYQIKFDAYFRHKKDANKFTHYVSKVSDWLDSENGSSLTKYTYTYH